MILFRRGPLMITSLPVTAVMKLPQKWGSCPM